ncbi:flagellar export chaperone FliS [Pilimelia columellifera]|uniref:Flagellar export chaperone FliS n=1 Tax=Pilimelia columellifera subsp. columellifera TaxID=706583 RepID=A0ABN3NAP8_9ACTN
MTTPSNPALRERYLRDAVATASPAKLLVMLYDRLVLDLARGEQALRDGDNTEARAQLQHAQDILMELRASLDTTLWDGGPGLAQLYSFLLTELIQANVRKEPDRVASCKTLVEPLRDAWREAATAAATPA